MALHRSHSPDSYRDLKPARWGVEFVRIHKKSFGLFFKLFRCLKPKKLVK